MKRTRTKTALVVDNDDQIQHLLRSVLENIGFQTQATWSGYEALAALESHPPDVLLVDNYLPDLHFGDFLKQVGHLAIQPWIIVMQALQPTGEEVRQYSLLGASHVLRKQDLSELCRAVVSCCESQLIRRVN